jgi:hypothetical protein
VPDHEPPRQLADHLVEIIDHERMPLSAPPVSDDALRKDDHVARLFLAVDTHAAEAVILDPRHLSPAG